MTTSVRSRWIGPGLLNVEMQSRVRLAERLFDGGGRLAPGKDEAEILPALGKRDHLLAGVHRDGDFLDCVDRRGLLDTAHRGESARTGDRNHHDAGGPPLALKRFQRASEGLAENQLLEAQARPEAERARAQAPDRP